MINQNTDIRYLKGIGEKRAELFNKLGVFTIGDLLRYLPRSYEDRTDVREIRDINEGESLCVKGSLASGIRSFRGRTGARVIQVRISDGTGILNMTWFNAPYVEKTLKFHFYAFLRTFGELRRDIFGKQRVAGQQIEHAR